MSQADFVIIGKFFIGIIGYFIGTGVTAIITSIVINGDEDVFLTAAWTIGGFAFAVLTMFV